MKFVVSVSLAFSFSFALSAQAKLEFCNSTKDTQSVAVAYKKDGLWVSEGWWNISSGDCSTILAGDLKNRFYYYRSTVNGAGFTGQDFFFCTQKSVFTISGQEKCKKRGFRKEEFASIDTGKSAKSYTLTLIPQDGSVPIALSKDAEQKSPSANTHEQQGTLGEPFTQAAVFQSCESQDGSMSCLFYANGWRWYAFEGAGTTRKTLVELSSLAPSSAVTLVGDVIQYGDVSVETAIYGFEFRQPTDFENTIAGLQGRWKDGNDPNSVWEVVGSEIHEYYNGDGVGESYFRFAERCNESHGRKGPFLIRTFPEDYQNPLCYFLLGWDAEFFQLSYAGGVNGQTLDFWKQF